MVLAVACSHVDQVPVDAVEGDSARPHGSIPSFGEAACIVQADDTASGRIACFMIGSRLTRGRIELLDESISRKGMRLLVGAPISVGQPAVSACCLERLGPLDRQPVQVYWTEFKDGQLWRSVTAHDDAIGVFPIERARQIEAHVHCARQYLQKIGRSGVRSAGLEDVDRAMRQCLHLCASGATDISIEASVERLLRVLLRDADNRLSTRGLIELIGDGQAGTTFSGGPMRVESAILANSVAHAIVMAVERRCGLRAGSFAGRLQAVGLSRTLDDLMLIWYAADTAVRLE